jgi:hypothetical protein
VIKQDPVEQSEEYKAIWPEVEQKIYARVGGKPSGMGACFLLWKAKKAILKEDYGIDWKSPAELNPGVKFD